MIPRLSSSKTWTHFPSEFLEQVQDLVAETFEDHLIDGAQLHLEGRIYTEEILFRLGISVDGQLKQSNFEASAHYSIENQNAKKIMHHCIEAAASMMAEYFDTDGEEDFPRQWTSFTFEGTPVFLQYSTINTALENEANRILGVSENNLVQEIESEDALDHSVEERIPVDPEFDSELEGEASLDSAEQDNLNFEGDDREENEEGSEDERPLSRWH